MSCPIAILFTDKVRASPRSGGSLQTQLVPAQVSHLCLQVGCHVPLAFLWMLAIHMPSSGLHKGFTHGAIS